jgi:autotransporter-associated beta strand protein
MLSPELLVAYAVPGIYPELYGGTYIEAGTLGVATEGALPGGSVTLASTSGATLDVIGISETIGSLNGGGNITLSGSQLVVEGGSFSGTISGGSMLLVDGTLTLDGQSTYGGTTMIVSGGEIEIATSNALPTDTTLMLCGGSVYVDGGCTQEVASLHDYGGQVLGPGTLIVG